MVISATSAGASPPAGGLVKTSTGEYTAASVHANPGQAAGLVRLKDGNYAYPIVSAADRAVGISASLTFLKRGG